MFHYRHHIHDNKLKVFNQSLRVITISTQVFETEKEGKIEREREKAQSDHDGIPNHGLHKKNYPYGYCVLILIEFNDSIQIQK